MVKERRKRRSRSRSSDSDDSEPVHRRQRSRSHSPKRSHHRTKHRHQEESRGYDEIPRIKKEPISDSDEEEKHSKRRIKQEHEFNRPRDRDRENRHRRFKQERIKQERNDSGDEMRNQREERRRNNERRQQTHGQRQNNLSEHERYGRRENESASNAEAEAQPKDAPNFELSGKLTEDTNTYKGVVIKYNEPPEARKPKKRWRLYPFKNDEPMKPFHMHRQSAYLLGRERLIADIPIDHPSCSKQHAVYQYRMVPYEKEDGRRAFRIAPYIIDLNSANGTFVNNKRIDPQRYVELFEKDVVKFGFSSREYVLLHDKSDTTELEDESD